MSAAPPLPDDAEGPVEGGVQESGGGQGGDQVGQVGQVGQVEGRATGLDFDHHDLGPADPEVARPGGTRVVDGRYRLGALLGEGGSAVVHSAWDERLGREVAVKLLHRHLPPGERARFHREMRTLSQLPHPGVIPIYDLGEDTGQVYFTMPLLRGGTILRLGPLEDEPDSIERFYRVAAFLGRTLEWVHRAGLVHRDLTPGNILLDASGWPRIMDFGLVALSEATRNLTRSGVTLGTPPYMAPEQARGVGVGRWSDLYALGAVLYRVACGSPPFVGDSDQSVLFQHVYEPPPHPQSLNPAVPDALSAVLLSLLAKAPEERPGSGEALADQLELARRDLWSAHTPAQYRGGRLRAGVQPGGPLSPASLAPAWSLPLGGEVTWPSALVGRAGRLAVGTRAGELRVVGEAGGPLQTLKAGDEVTAPAALLPGGGALYGAWDGVLRRVDAAGQQVWAHRTRAEITGAPTVWGDQVLASSRDGHLHAVDLETGRLNWAYRASGPLAASPLVWGAAAIVVDEEGWVHAADAVSGLPLWKVQLETVHATPALVPLELGPGVQGARQAEAALIVPCWGGEVHALHLVIEAGRARPHAREPLLWTYDLEEELWAAPAARADTAVVAGWGGAVQALDLRSGDERWSRRLEGRVTASPIISGGCIYLASEAGELCALELDSGREVWSRREPQGVQATPLALDGALYVAFMDGTLRCYRSEQRR